MNFNTLVIAVQSELNDYSSRTKTRIESWINEGHRSICQKRNWRFLIVHESDTMTFATTDFPVDLDTDVTVGAVAVAVQKIIAIWDITDGSHKVIDQTTLETLRDQFPTDYESTTPLYWYYTSDNKINIYPDPQADVDLIFSFQKKLSTYASGSTDALLIPDEYVDVLKEYVLYKAYRYKADDRSGSTLENYKELYDSMVDAEANKDPILYDRPTRRFYRFPTLVDAS